MNNKRSVGDLYWQQLSMWDFSKVENLDVYSDKGFHYELMMVEKVISDNQWTVRNIKVDELTKDQVESLTPKSGHNWHRVMGNIKDFK